MHWRHPGTRAQGEASGQTVAQLQTILTGVDTASWQSLAQSFSIAATMMKRTFWKNVQCRFLLPSFIANVLCIGTASQALAHEPPPRPPRTITLVVPESTVNAPQPAPFVITLPASAAALTVPAALGEKVIPHRHHLIIGATAAPFLTFDVHNGWKAYIGVSLLPELRYAFSADMSADTPRIFASVRWTGFSTAVPFQRNVAAKPVSELELMGAIGVSFRISRSLETRDRITTSVGWLSVGLGFGNLKSETGDLITGPSLLLSLDTDGLSFNIGGSR